MNKGLEVAIDGVHRVHDLDVPLESYAQGVLLAQGEHIGGKDALRSLMEAVKAWGERGSTHDFLAASRLLDVLVAMEAEQ